MIEIIHYVNEQGKDLFQVWVDQLRDVRAQARIYARIDRLALGNFGDCKALREGVLELRIDHGPGYRVYLSRLSDTGNKLVLLLCASSKSSQSRDIERAVMCLKDYARRTSKP
jgi:putative addiction module killer protein